MWGGGNSHFAVNPAVTGRGAAGHRGGGGNEPPRTPTPHPISGNASEIPGEGRPSEQRTHPPQISQGHRDSAKSQRLLPPRGAQGDRRTHLVWFSHWAPGREKKKIRKKEARKIGIKYGLQVSRKYQCLSVNCDVGARQAVMLITGETGARRRERCVPSLSAPGKSESVPKYKFYLKSIMSTFSL